jgi:hypothetical protein
LKTIRPIRLPKPKITPNMDKFLAMEVKPDPWDWLFLKFKMPLEMKITIKSYLASEDNR